MGSSNPTKKFFKNNLFFSVTEETPITEPVSTVTAPTTAAAIFPNNNNFGGTSFPVPPPVTAVSEAGQVEQQYLDHFMQFLESKNFEGLDYLEFANTLHKMYEKSGSNLSEASLYELAFVTFETQGISSAVLLKTAQQYIDLITTHKEEFDKFLSTEGSSLIQSKTEEITRLQKNNADTVLQLAQLQQQIANVQNAVNKNNQTIEANKILIQTETQKNQEKQRKFESAFKLVIQKIAGDVQKIQTYLK